MSEDTLPPPRGELIQLGAPTAQYENHGVLLEVALDEQRRLGPLFLRQVEIIAAGRTAQLEEIAETAAEGLRAAEARADENARQLAMADEGAKSLLAERNQALADLHAEREHSAAMTRERDDARLTIAEGRATLQDVERARDVLQAQATQTLTQLTALLAAVNTALDAQPPLFLPHPVHRDNFEALRAARNKLIDQFTPAAAFAPASSAPIFRCGDHVRHKPSGEIWVLAYADYERGEISAAGWPDSIEALANIELARAATDEEHAEAVRGWFNVSGDRRRDVVLRLYGANVDLCLSEPQPALAAATIASPAQAVRDGQYDEKV